MGKIFEYRGVSGLVYAEVIKDDNTGLTFGEVKPLAGVAEISKSTDSSNEAHYYDNLPAVVISSTGSDTITISTSGIEHDVLADITGQYYDSLTGMFVEKERKQKYFAIGYQTKTTSGDVMFVWRLKGSFNIPDQTSATENEGTDANGQELTYTGISTTKKFVKTGSQAKAITVNTTVNPIAENVFFGSVQTPDTINPHTVTPSVSVVPSNASVEAGSTIQLDAIVVPAGTAVSWTSGTVAKATVDSNGVVTGEAAGSSTITATITVDGTNYTDTCTITVVNPTA